MGVKSETLLFFSLFWLEWPHSYHSSCYSAQLLHHIMSQQSNKLNNSEEVDKSTATIQSKTQAEPEKNTLVVENSATSSSNSTLKSNLNENSNKSNNANNSQSNVAISDQKKAETPSTVIDDGGISLRPASSFFGGFFKKAAQPPAQKKPEQPVKKVEKKLESTRSKENMNISGTSEESSISDSSTNLEKKIYGRIFLNSFRQSFNDMPEELRQNIIEFPEINLSILKTTITASPIEKRQRQPKTQSQPSKPRPQSPIGLSKSSPLLERRASVPWVPRPTFMKEEQDQALRDVKGVLNKITPEKFQKLSQNLVDVFTEIIDENIYVEAVGLVFMKACSEPHFSKTYAELCLRLSHVIPKANAEKLVFRRALLNKCQEEFEKTSAKIEKLPDDPEEAAILIAKERKRKLGNVKFIGELFKFKLLSEKIIHGCIKLLFTAIFKNAKEDRETMEMNCELLCKLLSTIGKLIDIPEARSYIDTYFAHISKLSQDPKISVRVRFMLQAIMELRQNRWVPRREENAPKKIAEVHADALQKQLAEEIGLNAVSPRTTPTSTPSIEPKKASKPKKKKPEEKKTENTNEQIENIIKELLNSGNIKEATSLIKELQLSPEMLSFLVEFAINTTMESDESDRELISKFFSSLYKERVLSESNFMKGFRTIVDSLPDLEIDIPFAPKLLGRFISSAVAEKFVSLSWVEGLPEKIRVSMTEALDGRK